MVLMLGKIIKRSLPPSSVEGRRLHVRRREKEPTHKAGFTRFLCWTGLGIGLALVSAYGLLWLWIDDPLDLEPPKDRDLVALFSNHKAIFQRIVTMAQEDREPGWRPDVSSAQKPLPADRVKSYKNLIPELGSGVVVTWDHKSDGVNFVFVTGGALLAVGAEWWKGIAYIPNRQDEDGTLIQRLDGAKRLEAGRYLRQIDENWFLFYERTE